jgi:hypothetical protein
MNQRVLIVLLTAGVAAAAARVAEPAHQRQAHAAAVCGVERWAVKTLQDRPRLLRAQATTIAHLSALRPPPAADAPFVRAPRLHGDGIVSAHPRGSRPGPARRHSDGARAHDRGGSERPDLYPERDSNPQAPDEGRAPGRAGASDLRARSRDGGRVLRFPPRPNGGRTKRDRAPPDPRVQLSLQDEAGDPSPNRPLLSLAPMVYPTGGCVPQSTSSTPGASVTCLKPVPSTLTV